jgi:hypothetical protein
MNECIIMANNVHTSMFFNIYKRFVFFKRSIYFLDNDYETCEYIRTK